MERGQTLGELAGAAALLALFVLNETRVAKPLVPLSIFRVRGLAAADVTQVIGIAGFYSVFYFVTLYMQDVLGFSAFRAARPTCRSRPWSPCRPGSGRC